MIYKDRKIKLFIYICIDELINITYKNIINKLYYYSEYAN